MADTIWFNGRTFKVRTVGSRYAVDYHVQGANQNGYVISSKVAKLGELLRQQKLAAGGRALLPIKA